MVMAASTVASLLALAAPPACDGSKMATSPAPGAVPPTQLALFVKLASAPPPLHTMFAGASRSSSASRVSRARPRRPLNGDPPFFRFLRDSSRITQVGNIDGHLPERGGGYVWRRASPNL